MQLDIRGSADHTHTVAVTAEAVQAIEAGQAVRKESTNTNAHVHSVTFNSDSGQAPSDY